uniref:Uncharacterized protein n=1 Tax=Plectus sambesii TaxID=2011161 RepID=A0A914XLG6_9BILA
MSRRSAYSCQLQACNSVLIVLGLIAVGLAGSQFSDIAIDNYREIDLRLLNWIHVLTGVVGIYSVVRKYGSIAIKTLYSVSIVIGICTAIFYGFTTAKVAKVYNELRGYSQKEGFEEDGYSNDAQLNIGKLVVCGIMIGVGALAAVVSLIAQTLLEKLAINYIPPATKQHIRALQRNKTRLMTIAVIKLLAGCGTLALATYLEYQYGMEGRDQYIVIALDHIAAVFAVCSAFIDLCAITGYRQNLLNLKVSVVISVVTAVWCLKAVDYMMATYFVNDLQSYLTYNGQQNDASASKEAGQKFITVIVHAGLIVCLMVLFFLSTVAAVQAGSCMELGYGGRAVKADRGLTMQRRCLGVLHVLWGLLCVALLTISLLDVPFSDGFADGDLLWLAVLFIATGLVSAGHASSLTTSVFVMSVLSLATAAEQLALSINRVYQSSTREEYFSDTNTVFTGRVVLYSVQTGVLLAECVTSLATAILFGRALVRLPSAIDQHSNVPHVCLSFGILFYAIMLTGVRVVFELGRWRYDAQPLVRTFVRIGNGPVAFATFVVQLCCSCRDRLLLPASILQTVVAALALFVIAPCTTNLYFLFATFPDKAEPSPLLRLSDNERLFLTIALILTAVCALACVLATAFGTFSALRSSHLLHRKATMSATVSPIYDERANGKVVVPLRGESDSSVNLYWTADENPYYYNPQRYYGHPYQIESGFYGYAVAGAPRMRISSAAQTRIGHVFDNGRYAIAYPTSSTAR